MRYERVYVVERGEQHRLKVVPAGQIISQIKRLEERRWPGAFFSLDLLKGGLRHCLWYIAHDAAILFGEIDSDVNY